MSFKCRKGLGVTNSVLREVPNSWCTYMEGTRTENEYRSRNSIKISKGETKQPGCSIWYQEIE